LWLCAETLTGGDPTTCGGLHGRWRVKVISKCFSCA
jgi:hypothetical protein